MQSRFKQWWYGTFLRLPWIFKQRWLWWKSKQLCFYCTEELTRKTFTVDHYTPKSRGGTNRLSNLVACCKFCNKVKANLLMDDGLLAEMKRMKLVRDRHRK